MQKQIKINNDMITYETRGQKENDKNDKTYFYFTMSTTSTNNMCTLPIFQKLLILIFLSHNLTCNDDSILYGLPLV